MIATSQPLSFLFRPIVEILERSSNKVQLLVRRCVKAFDSGVYFSFNFAMLVLSVFDEVVDTSERALSDAQVIAHFAVNKNIN